MRGPTHAASEAPVIPQAASRPRRNVWCVADGATSAPTFAVVAAVERPSSLRHDFAATSINAASPMAGKTRKSPSPSCWHQKSFWFDSMPKLTKKYEVTGIYSHAFPLCDFKMPDSRSTA